jgi:hypothetical protein
MGGLIWTVVSGISGLILAIVFGVLLVTKRKIPVAVTPIAVALPALGGLAVNWFYMWGWDPAADPGAAELAAATVTMTRMVVFLVSAPVCTILVIFCAVAGARPGPRRMKWASAGAVLIFATCVMTLLGAEELTLLFSWVRAVAYLFLGWMVAVAMMSGDPEKSTGPEAGATAALSFAIFVGTGESALRGLVEFLSIMELREPVAVGREAERIDLFYAATASELPFMWGTVVLACMVAGVGMAGALQGGKRTTGSVAAAFWLLLPPFLLMNDFGRDRMVELSLALSGL